MTNENTTENNALVALQAEKEFTISLGQGRNAATTGATVAFLPEGVDEITQYELAVDGDQLKTIRDSGCTFFLKGVVFSQVETYDRDARNQKLETKSPTTKTSLLLIANNEEKDEIAVFTTGQIIADRIATILAIKGHPKTWKEMPELEFNMVDAGDNRMNSVKWVRPKKGKKNK